VSRWHPETAEERFWVKVDASGDCWEWTAGANALGYGTFVPDSASKKKVKAHRFAWETLIGPIGKGLVIDHLCRNPRCVNPDHLEPVTQRMNIMRGYSRSVRNAKVTHCPRGHEYDEANTRFDPNGGRKCRACHRMWVRQQKRKNADSIGERCSA